MAESIAKDPVAPVLGNPAVVGLGGFGLTTMLLQFHNLGWMGIGPVIWSGFIFGGVGQLIAGYQEQRTGNNFGYAAFCGYGAFWIILCAYLVGSTSGNKMLALTENDLGFFMLAYFIFTAGLLIASLKIHMAMFLTFLTLTVGFALLTLVFWGHKSLLPIAAWDLLACAGLAWYMMFHVVFLGVFGRNVLPVGGPLA